MAKNNNKAWIVSVDMGYGHQRTAYPLRDIAFSGRIVNANSYVGIPPKDKRFWQGTQSLYEFISRFKRIPIVGDIIFSVAMDRFQRILTYYFFNDFNCFFIAIVLI